MLYNHALRFYSKAHMNTITQVSIVIPVYNEVDNIAPLCDEIDAALNIEHEIIFVNDGSDDGTREQLLKLVQQFQQVRALNHRRNFGQSASILTGVRAAQYQWVITIDGDRQNDPADIPLLVAQLNQQQHTAIVVGNRVKRLDSWLKRISSTIANKVRGALLRDNCPDTSCSLKLFPRDEFLKLPHFNHLHRFLPALFKRAGFTVINIPVNHRPRTQGKSKYGINNRLWAGIHDVLGVIWLLKRPCQPELDHEHH